MAAANVNLFGAMSAENRADLIESRASMARSVLNILLSSMQEDSPPVESEVINTIWAVTELLSVPEAVA